MCGGTGRQLPRQLPQPGLSPRVRGNHENVPTVTPSIGSIPACAGEPTPYVTRPTSSQVYPRVCGGTSWQRHGATASPGLSPRVRGNLSVDKFAKGFDGSIPACAGEPGQPLQELIVLAVYPRVCGGTGRTVSYSRPEGGLSPRVRGNRSLRSCKACVGRSIPACAGEPVQGSRGQLVPSVYPRVCGGTFCPLGRWPHLNGLSPRVRGNQLQPVAA